MKLLSTVAVFTAASLCPAAVFAAPRNLPLLPTADFAERAFVMQKAPVLKFEKRMAPRLYGVDYPFAPQTARGVALFSRFPPFTLRDRRIHVSGPWYSDAHANLHFSRGITSIEALPNFRLPNADPSTDVRFLPRARKWQLINDPLLWRHAGELADELAAKNPQDERIAPLRVLASDHKFVPHEAAYREVGKHLWRGETAPSTRCISAISNGAGSICRWWIRTKPMATASNKSRSRLEKSAVTKGCRGWNFLSRFPLWTARVLA
ncbi:MAG: hypothetical protein ACR2MB_04330 [Acidimicrobiales bacterium]